VTPPGFMTVNGVTSACVEGAFRAEWKPPSAASACEVCGDGINSTAAEQLALYDPDTEQLSTVAVRASAASCCKYQCTLWLTQTLSPDLHVNK
jgi:hypothetical protein